MAVIIILSSKYYSFDQFHSVHIYTFVFCFVFWVFFSHIRYKTEFGFILKDRAIIVDDIRVRGAGKALAVTDTDLKTADGPPQEEKVQDILFNA